MKRLVLALGVVLVSISIVHADSGLVSIKSSHSVGKTLDRLTSLLKEKGMTIFARIDHSEGAKKVGQELRPTELLIFGNPKIGSQLMRCGQTAAIDLPQKMVAWEDESGGVWLSYNDPEYVKARHGIHECGDVSDKIKKALGNFSQKAANP